MKKITTVYRNKLKTRCKRKHNSTLCIRKHTLQKKEEKDNKQLKYLRDDRVMKILMRFSSMAKIFTRFSSLPLANLLLAVRVSLYTLMFIFFIKILSILGSSFSFSHSLYPYIFTSTKSSQMPISLFI